MRPLSLSEVIQLHEYLLEQSGGITGIRDLGALESAVAQPHMAFRGVDLYQTIQEKAARSEYLATNLSNLGDRITQNNILNRIIVGLYLHRVQSDCNPGAFAPESAVCKDYHLF